MPDLYIGLAGWSYKDWEGVVYPAGIRKKQHPVEYLAQFFDLIEINTSFYGHIRPAMGRQWAEKAAAANPRFLFTAKLNRAFTHSPIANVESTSAATIRPAQDDEKLAKEGLDSIAGEGRLGALLAQFPFSFKNTEENRAYLEQLLERFRAYPMAVEVRHSSWNDEATLAAFAARQVAFCNIDQPKIGASLRPTEHVTAPLAYVRLHGRHYDQWFSHTRVEDRYNYLYTPEELERWHGRIVRIAEKSEKTFVVANNHFAGQAPVNALELRHLATGGPVAAPELLVKAYPRLEPIVSRAAPAGPRPARQPRLL